MSIIALSIFMAGILAIAGFMGLTKVEEEISQLEMSTDKAEEFIGDSKAGINTLDIGLVVLLGFEVIASIFFGLRVKSNPMYFIGSLLALVVTAVMAAELANTFYMFSQVEVLQPAVSQFGTFYYTMKNYPLVFIGLGSVAIIGTYAKVKQNRVELGI
jgi:hypothetical protein